MYTHVYIIYTWYIYIHIYMYIHMNILNILWFNSILFKETHPFSSTYNAFSPWSWTGTTRETRPQDLSEVICYFPLGLEGKPMFEATVWGIGKPCAFSLQFLLGCTTESKGTTALSKGFGEPDAVRVWKTWRAGKFHTCRRSTHNSISTELIYLCIYTCICVYV